MKKTARVGLLTLVGGVVAACSGNGAGHASGASSNANGAAPAIPDRDMIVILRDQRTDLPGSRGSRELRVAALRDAQRPIIAELQNAHARTVHSFGLMNGFATKLSAPEVAALTTNPLVASVVPDAMIRLPRLTRDNEGASTAVTTGNLAPNADALCGTLEPEALQLTNAAFLDTTIPQAQEVKDGNGVKVTGRGVKVAFIADGLDTTNPGFIRPDGSSVFVDYQDFSGDPAGTPTAGGEAFGDATSIAGQDMPNGTPLTFDLSTVVSAAHPLPSPCNIRIRGMAPGASLVGLKVFSNLGYTTESSFVQAVEWAVLQDDVDVINESFGSNPYADFGDDPTSMVNNAAIRAGVTVSVSSGDSGTAGTIGSPATDNASISAGASTQFRLYAQLGYAMMPLAQGYMSDNISSLSSGGFAQRNARTVDVVAPGDLGWAYCSPNIALYQDCTGFNGLPSPIQAFGGTSEAAPLTAGVAALVIQAFRSVSGGESPSPALVKQIIMSTAKDIGAPSFEEGAGRIDALGAVQMALALGGQRAYGAGVFASPTSADMTVPVNQAQRLAFTLTNTGTTTQHLAPAIEAFGSPQAGQSYTLALAPATDAAYLNVDGAPRPYIEQSFTVPAGMDHLDAEIAFAPFTATGDATIASLALLDPTGRQVAYSLPQGTGSGYGHVDVVKPTAGRWIAVIETTPTTIRDSYTGAVELTWAAEQYTAIGTVQPSRVDLAPGQSVQLTAQFNSPATAGNLAAAVRLHDSTTGIATSEIPVTVRTLIPTGATGGAFTSTLTGGNGRPGGGPTQTLAFDVPAGVNDLAVALNVSDSGYSLAGYLVDPNGMVLSSASNVDVTGAPESSVQLFHANPQPGRWLFVLEEIVSSGKQTSIPVTGRIAFNSGRVSATGLPTSRKTKLSASAAPLSVPVVVTNTGDVTKSFFVDARLNTSTSVTLPVTPYTAPQLPGMAAYAYVPTETTAVQFVASSTVPLMMDVAWLPGGDPDLWAASGRNNTTVASIQVPEVPFGLWWLTPALIPPFPADAGAPTEAVTTTATAETLAFDSNVTSSAGDLWADLTFGTSTYNPVTLAPGASTTITLTFAPAASAVGTTVSGTLFVDAFNANDGYGSGDEVTSLPYEYSVVK